MVAKALLKASIRDDNPVVFLEHKRLYGIREDARGDEPAAEIGRGRIARAGSDVTLVSAMKGVHDCLAAAEQLAEAGVDAEVIDLQTLRPLDTDLVLESLAKTNRLAVVEEGPLTGGWAGEILALVAEHGLADIDDVWRLTTPDHPIPYSPVLEDAFLPGTDAIVASVTQRLGISPAAGV